MKILGVAWIGVVSDKPETRAFYSRTLGLDLISEAELFAYYAVGEKTQLEILSSETSSAASLRPGAPAVGFLVADLDGAVEELRAEGVRMSEVEEWRSGNEVHRWVYFADPEGHILSLVERK